MDVHFLLLLKDAVSERVFSSSGNVCVCQRQRQREVQTVHMMQTKHICIISYLFKMGNHVSLLVR